MRIFQYISILLCIIIISVIIYKNSPHYQIIKGDVFGTYYNIKIRTNNKNKDLKSKIESKLEDINQQMSVFREDSEISNFNKTKSQKWHLLSDDFAKVLQASHKVWKLSNGWFDPTIGKLIELWGFGTITPQNPSDKQIKKALVNTGFAKLKFNSSFQKVKKTHPNIEINLSAIAKGYAVDAIAQILDKEGYNNYLVEIGGEIKAKGSRLENNNAWNIGISKPIIGSSENSIILSLSNIAVATSGNYRNFYQKNGQIYAHTISPKTGYSVQTDVLSASVFHDSCMYADAHATAIVAMGLKAGMAYANKNNLKVIVFDKNLNIHYSKDAKFFLGE